MDSDREILANKGMPCGTKIKEVKVERLTHGSEVAKDRLMQVHHMAHMWHPVGAWGRNKEENKIFYIFYFKIFEHACINWNIKVIK